MTAIPSPSVMNMNFYVTTSADNPHAFDAIAYLVGKFPALADSGVTGYPIIFNSAANSLDGGKTKVSGIMGKLIMLNTANGTELVHRLQTLYDHINATWPGFSFAANTTYYPSFNAWYAENYDSTPAGYNNVMGSRLLDEQALTANATALKVALEKFSAGGQATVYIVSGKGVFNAKPRGGSNAVGPAWRRTYVHASESRYVPRKLLNANANKASFTAHSGQYQLSASKLNRQSSRHSHGGLLCCCAAGVGAQYRSLHQRGEWRKRINHPLTEAEVLMEF
jgi:hypothetical protein